MLYIISLISLIFIVFDMCKFNKRLNGKCFTIKDSGFIFGILFALILAIFILNNLLIQFFTDEYKNSMIDDDSIKKSIYALKDDSEIDGKFFLGIGKIDEKYQFRYMEKDKYGYKMKTMEFDKDKVRIQYTDKNPYVEKLKLKYPYIKKSSKAWWYKFLTFRDINSSLKTIREEKIIFHIPKNSIRSRFNVDFT